MTPRAWPLTDTPPGLGTCGLPGPGEWWLPDLAREIGGELLVIHRLRRYGRVRAHQRLQSGNGSGYVALRAAVFLAGPHRRRERREDVRRP